eukprot:scaffold21867_cov48-Phaeocystis_antarctica.AAC.3
MGVGLVIFGERASRHRLNSERLYMRMRKCCGGGPPWTWGALRDFLSTMNSSALTSIRTPAISSYVTVTLSITRADHSGASDSPSCPGS